MSDRLSEIEGRIASATPGPWVAFPLEGNLEGPRGRVAEVGMWKDSDAELIAHAPADLAALVKFAREVEARHRPVHPDWVRPGDQICEECIDSADYAAGSPGVGWPCPTAVAVQRLRGCGPDVVWQGDGVRAVASDLVAVDEEGDE